MPFHDRPIALVDDDDSLRDLIEESLSKRGYTVVAFRSANEVLERLGHEEFAIVLTDINMEGISGLDLCERILAVREDIPVILMTAFGSIETAIGAIRAGAYDFLIKPFDMDALSLVIERAMKFRALETELRELRKRVGDGQASGSKILGSSPAVQRMLDLIGRVAESEATVLVRGESGTGKELVARHIHAKSIRQAGPFVAINCAAMPEALLESELFGHAKGAFTDAKVARPGLLVKACNGTLFLDEIGEMTAGMQAKLLRALQERTMRPVGGDIEVPFDVRIVAATHRDLDLEVEAQRFREDLYYRINVVTVDVPPLRTRGNDVLTLATHFLSRFVSPTRATKLVGFTPAVAERFLTYPWPGNVRELQNCMERAAALANGESVSLEDLPRKIRTYRVQRVDLQTTSGGDPRTMPSMDEIERRYIRQVLDAVSGNKGVAAEILGFDRRTLYRKLGRMAAEEVSPSPVSLSSE